MSANEMSQQLNEEQWIRAYFLGDLPESEEERIQERLFTDRDFFESLLIVEGELVDDYALGLISDRDRAKLESGFLTSPHQYRNVEFVRTLDRYIASNKAVPSRLRQVAPSFFPRLRSRFAKSAPPFVPEVELAATQRPVRGDIYEEREVKEPILREAAAKRKFLECLIANDWLGLELLLQLKSGSQVSRTDLGALVKRDDASLTAALSLLVDSGLVAEAAGKYTCSSFGSEILKRIKTVTAHDLL
jgi:hypothetical protein